MTVMTKARKRISSGLPTASFPGVRLGIAVLGAALSLAVSDGTAQERTFVETLGSDTTSVETWERTGRVLEGRFLTRVPVTRIVTYRGEFGRDGGFRSFDVRFETPATNPDGPAAVEARYAFEPDSIRMVIERDGETMERSVARPDGLTVPFLNKLPVVYGIFDHVSRVAAARGGDVDLYTLSPGGRNAAPNAFRTYEDGRVSMSDFGRPVMARVDREGRLLSVDASPTTHKTQANPAAGVDLQALARRYARMDAEGRGMGPASTRDTVRVASAGAEFTIDYGRPAKRGRAIWGELVPFGQVWRTGADAATHFSTSHDLRVNGEPLPAGDYTLWTLPRQSGMTLIINEQTGQWGTQHDPERDFLRVNMTRIRLQEPVERLTLDIEPTEQGGILVLRWDQLAFTVPLEVR